MKGCLPNWKMENDSRSFSGLTKEKNHFGPDNELIELVRRNGHVALHSQTSCRALSAICETKQILNPDSLLKCEDSNVNSSNFVDEDESGVWFQYHLDDSIDKEFFEVFNGILAAEPVTVDKTMKEDINACAKQPDFYPHENTKALSNSIRDDSSAIVNFSNPQKLTKDDFVSERNFCEEASSSETVAGLGDSSSMNTIPYCGNNQVDVSGVWNKLSRGKGSLMRSLNDRLHEKAYESAIASSSGRSRRSTTNHGYKRKGRDAEEYEGFSEDVEYESAEANKPAQRPTSGRRSRSAEVHNLSERRRRDRINEKMRALQELIPHCNKSDKASMLDEVIEYLKSLRLQLQIMWMGNGVASMLCPNSQQYMSSMGIGVNQIIQNPVQIPRAASNDQSGARISMPNQPPVSFRQGLSSINFAAQIHDFHLPEQNSSYIGFPQMQLAPQVMNMCTFEPQVLQQNQMVSAVDKQHHVKNKSSI